MAVPATTGQLRTNIADMEIGDYISCNYQAASGAQGTFSNLGKPAGTEIPVSGTATPNGTFYYVKVQNGILVADRCVQVSRSWDSINSNKCIQGLPWDAGNIIPTMTSNTSLGGIASASSFYKNDDMNNAWHAFDGIISSDFTNFWESNNELPAWLQYQFSEPKKVKQYTLTCSAKQTDSMASSWQFLGSNDGKDWTILDQVSNVSWAVGEKKTFNISEPGFYMYYRILATACIGNFTWVRIAELQMLDAVGTIRSLTGGVAYADKDGNKSTTDQGYGGWPTNNEWDKYIVNFPQEKIQEGKTLDDIFHWNGINSWCQDTLANGIAINKLATSVTSDNTRRIHRGSYSEADPNRLITDFWASKSSYTGSIIGFRPVFEYKE